jgi:hypothetical protein
MPKLVELLSDQTRWCKLNAALDERGKSCHPTEARAYAFCLVGGLAHCYSHDTDKWLEARRLLFAAILEKYPTRPAIQRTLTNFNDAPDTTFEMVRAVLEAADV